MKVQPTIGALPTRDVIRTLAEPRGDDDAKLTLGHCFAIAMQLTASLGACGMVHWIMT